MIGRFALNTPRRQSPGAGGGARQTSLHRSAGLRLLRRGDAAGGQRNRNRVGAARCRRRCLKPSRTGLFGQPKQELGGLGGMVGFSIAAVKDLTPLLQTLLWVTLVCAAALIA